MRGSGHPRYLLSGLFRHSPWRRRKIAFYQGGVGTTSAQGVAEASLAAVVKAMFQTLAALQASMTSMTF